MLLSCKKKMLSGNLVQSVSHMYMHISLKVKQGFREEGDLIVLYVSKKNIEGQKITDLGLDGKTEWGNYGSGKESVRRQQENISNEEAEWVWTYGL